MHARLGPASMILWVACSGSQPLPASAEPPPTTEVVNDPRFHEDLLAIARSYASMTRADGTYWAPEDCRAPVHPAFASEAKAGPHGKKLYTLFVSDYASYAALTGHEVKAPKFRSDRVPDFAQTIVKEAWVPVATSELATKCKNEGLHGYLAPVMVDGVTYRAWPPACSSCIERRLRTAPTTVGCTGRWCTSNDHRSRTCGRRA